MATTRPLRADAQRNRDRLLDVAVRALADGGADVTLEAIAREAGVGIGTLYRHFPTRQDLQEAVFLDQVEELRRRSEELANDPDPLASLVSWLRLQVDMGSFKRKLGTAVMTAKRREGSPIQESYGRACTAGAALLQRAKDAGQVRADVELDDLTRLLHGVVLTADEEPDGNQRMARMFDLIVAGLRP